MSQADRLSAALDAGLLTPPATGPILVLRAQPSAAYTRLGPSRVLCEQGFRPLHDALAAMGLRVTAAAASPAMVPAMVIVHLTRARAENLGNIARGLRLLAPGGVLAVTGAKTDGIDSVRARVGEVLPIAQAFAKAHGKLFWLNRPETLPPAVAAWAAAAAPRRNADGYLTAPGMFSHDGIDEGSGRLAALLPQAGLRGRVADLGAGWGWLAAQALAASPAITRLDLYEADARTLEAAQANVPDPRAAFHWADTTRLAPSVPPYDAVLSNPPFHEGRAAAPALGAAFIAAAARILKPSGRLLMVANRQLPYEAPLTASFTHTARLFEDRSFKVLSADHPRRT